MLIILVIIAIICIIGVYYLGWTCSIGLCNSSGTTSGGTTSGGATSGGTTSNSDTIMVTRVFNSTSCGILTMRCGDYASIAAKWVGDPIYEIYKSDPNNQGNCDIVFTTASDTKTPPQQGTVNVDRDCNITSVTGGPPISYTISPSSWRWVNGNIPPKPISPCCSNYTNISSYNNNIGKIYSSTPAINGPGCDVLLSTRDQPMYGLHEFFNTTDNTSSCTIIDATPGAPYVGTLPSSSVWP